jgi:predicted nucleic acid-binding protein
MTHGIDTDFLVAAEILDHPFHDQADALLTALLSNGHDLALAPQTLAEFIHIVTDGKRMPRPLGMAEAIRRATHWWQAAEIVRVFPDGAAATDFLSWLQLHGLGRKRLLDTLLAATFHRAGIRRIITNNERDYRDFGSDLKGERPQIPQRRIALR